MIDNVVAALGLGLNLTDQEIADVLWLAVQMQQFGDGEISEQGDRNEALENSVSNRESPKQPAQPLRDADRDRQDENKEDEQNFEVHSKNDQGDDRSTRRSDELQLKIPDARSLQKPLELARSLRPLMRRVPSQVNTLLDEEATVRRIAEEKIWCPVLRPALEPWLDLALVIDDSASMLMWRHTIAELQHFLSSYGVFRDVRVWRLGTDKAEKVCIYAGATASDRNGSPRSPSELIEANGRGLVLVVSDCIAPIWRNGAIATALQIWSRSGMVAILQMLPDWLWARTALGRGVAAQFSALAAGIPNYQLTTTTVSTWYDIDLATSIKIPVVTLEPEKFTAWAEMLAGKGGAWSAGIVFEPELFAVPEVAIEFDGASVLDAEDRVQSFRLTASPIARRLAGLLAAAPVISLPIVRILQSKVLTQSQPVHVAEVFLGGLLKPLSAITAKTNPNYVQYDFIEGVRDLLLESVPSSEIVNIVAEVSEYIAERLGISLEEFGAIIRHPQQVENTELVSQTRPFALLTAQILKRLGVEYTRFAEEVENASTILPPQLQKIDSTIPNNRLVKKILILTANPKNTTRLELDEEVAKIQESLENSRERDRFEVVTVRAVTTTRLRRAMLTHNPHIVHFAGHGAGEQGLVLQNEAGDYCLVSSTSLADLFRLFTNRLECIVLNAMHSEVQAKEITQYLNFVVALSQSQSIPDSTAVLFASGFYRALGEGRSIEDSFSFGCNAIQLAGGISESNVPVLMKKAERNILESNSSLNEESFAAEISSNGIIVKRILVLSTNLKTNGSESSLNSEVRDIEAALQRSKNRDQFEIITARSATKHNLQRVLLDHNPYIVHFCSGEIDEEGITFENETGKKHLVKAALLADLFSLFNSIECVVLNGCYLEVQAYAISQYVNYVVGTSNVTSKELPAKFAVGFYDALGAGRSIEDSYAFGCNAIALDGISDEFTPALLKGSLAKTSGVNISVVANDRYFYVVRSRIELRCCEEVVKEGSFIRIKSPERMGKTCLMVRVLKYAEQQGYRTVVIDLREANIEIFADIEKFMKWFCASVGKALVVQIKPEDYWDDIFGANDNSTDYLETYLLNGNDLPLVIAIDNFDRVFGYSEIETNFCGLLRGWHERSRSNPIWRKLRLIIVHSQESYAQRDINQSPFNVGLPIELGELEASEVLALANAYGLVWSSLETEKLMDMIGGHPYLVQKAIDQLIHGDIDLDMLLSTAPTEEGIFGDYLNKQLQQLETYPDLVVAMKKAVNSDGATRLGSKEAFKLDNMGLVKRQGNDIVSRCNLYRLYFRDRLK